jgi:hypothetical protein
MFLRELEAANGVDVAGEGDLELPGGEVPELDGSVCGA